MTRSRTSTMAGSSSPPRPCEEGEEEWRRWQRSRGGMGLHPCCAVRRAQSVLLIFFNIFLRSPVFVGRRDNNDNNDDCMHAAVLSMKKSNYKRYSFCASSSKSSYDRRVFFFAVLF
mmetsp:Transcript_37213/g.61263  ORF Transcript_37213/g.61263 Transcript_37213/m.61263 type:complete len:116 (-) Transcript_37213:230-577(-)